VRGEKKHSAKTMGRVPRFLNRKAGARTRQLKSSKGNAENGPRGGGTQKPVVVRKKKRRGPTRSFLGEGCTTGDESRQVV